MKTSSLFLSLLLLAPMDAAAALTRIGAAAAVRGQVQAMAPEAEAFRAMSSGKTVWHNDTVKTDAQGRMQVMLLDETVFTIGPNTELIIDEFVFDPTTDAGKVSARITKGVFRFVTGKIARKKPLQMKVKLPVGTIGIRGTIAAGSTDGTSAIVALLGPGTNNDSGEKPGAISVTNAGVTVEITQPGFGTEIVGPDVAPTPPFKFSAEQLARVDAAPLTKPGDGGNQPAKTSPEPGGKAPPSEESGAKTAEAQGDLTQTESTGQIAGGNSDVSKEAAVDQAEESLATTSSSGVQWSDLMVYTGSAFYNGSATTSCTGGAACGSSGSVSVAFHFLINFGACTIGGGGNSSHVAFDSGSLGSGGTIDAEIPTISFSALTGGAKLTFGTDFTAANSNPDFNGTSFSFGDAGGSATANVQFTGGSVSDTAFAGASGATISPVSVTATIGTSCSGGTCPANPNN